MIPVVNDFASAVDHRATELGPRPMRLTIVQTHPIQYCAPWFRHLATACPRLDLSVVYASHPTPRQQGVEFDRPFEWDTALLDGYRSSFVRDVVSDADFSSASFRGIDAPGISDTIVATRPDVVLVPGWHSIALVRAILACRRRGIPVLYRGDTHMDLAPRGWRRVAWRLRTRALLHLFTAHLAVGSRSREYLRAHGIAPARIFASPHAVDNAFFAAHALPYRVEDVRRCARASLGCAPDEFVVAFVGKLGARKRAADAIDAIATMRTGVRLLVAGSGPEERDLRLRAERLGVAVTWLGFVNQQALGRVYGVADCLVIPSAHESWGLVVNEALATGLPVVASDILGCVPDLVRPGRTGELFRAGDVAGLASALSRVRDAGGRAGLSRNCLEVAERHSLDRASIGLVAACEAVAGDKRPRVIACCGGMVIAAGLERMTFEVLRAVREDGGRVHAIVNDWENHRIVPLAEAIGATWSTGFYGHTFTRRPDGVGAVARMLVDIVRTSAGLLRDALRVHPTHVLVPEYVAAIRNLLALPLLRAVGTTVVLRLGNAPEPGRFYRRLWRRVINPLVDRFVCNSDFTERELLAHGIRPEKVTRIYNTVPQRAESGEDVAPRDPHRVVYAGQVIPEKGLDRLLEAVAIVRARGVPATLDVVGAIDGWIAPAYEQFREALLQRAASPDLAGRVRFLGWREDVPSILRSAAVHCCPSQPRQREAFGVVVVEAKCAGVPSVVTPVGALPELVTHRVDGWVAADTSADALADGLEYFLRDRLLAESAGRAAAASAARFGRDRFARAWREVFA